MKTLFIILTTALLTMSSNAGIVTLIAQYQDSTNNFTELSIGASEIVELVSFPRSINRDVNQLIVTKSNVSVAYVTATTLLDPLIVSGPATLRLVASVYAGKALCTVRVIPESFPPDRTVLVAPGTNQARITLECSTNLLHWSAATNGVYGPLPEAKFFRIKLEPVP